MKRLALSLALVASPASAQVVYPPVVVDTKAIATKAEVQAVAATIPQIADSVPAADMSTSGVVGSSNLVRRNDAQAPRVSRTVSGTTTTGGTAVVTWTAMASVPKLVVTPYVASTETLPPRCYPVAGSVTAAGATIKCYRDRALLALLQLPAEAAPAGIQFDVLALPGS